MPALLNMYKANMALAKPKVWSRKKLYRHFEHLQLKKLNIATMDAGLRQFKRLKELSISQNEIRSGLKIEATDSSKAEISKLL